MTGLDDYAAAHTKITISGWFESRPDVESQVKDHLLRGTAPIVIWHWLREEYGFPYSKQGMLYWGDRRTHGS